MTFYIDLRQWRTVAEFTQHLAQHQPSVAPWARGVVLHHTASPTLASWQGAKTMRSMANYYARLGWDRGPHLFIAVGSRSADHDGIWQMTPLNLKGIHATTANSWAWGIEVVGNYDTVPWSAETHAMVKGATLSLMDWRGITVSAQTLIGHREVPSPKSCPGRMVNMNFVRAEFYAAQRG